MNIRRLDVRNVQSARGARSFPKRDRTRPGAGSRLRKSPYLSRLEYNGWPGWERRAPVAKVANLWAAPRLFRDLRAEEKCIALNKFMARPRLWSTRSSWRAPRRVSPNRNSPLVLQPSSLSSPSDEAAPYAFTEKRRSRLDTLPIYFLFVKNSPRPRVNI